MTQLRTVPSAKTSRSSSRTLGSRLLGLALLTLSGAATAAEPTTFYIPFAWGTTDTADLPNEGFTYTRWESVIGALNTASIPGSVTLKALHGNGAALGAPGPCHHEVPLGPHVGANVIPCVDDYPEPGVGMLVLETTPGVLVRAEVQRARFRCNCAGLGCVPIPQGQAVLPVFKGLVPASATATSGPVELGNFDLPDSCASANQQYRRRVNLTLYNGGDEPATFRVVETPNRDSAASLFSTEVVVEPKGVLQINSLRVPTQPSSDLYAQNSGSRIWINVTANQPFLSYVSTVFDDPEVGALPFQVYPGSVAD